MRLAFTVYGKAEPQGSSRAFIIGGKARITSANAKMKPWRQQVTACALDAASSVSPNRSDEPMFLKHVPVRLVVDFTFRKPESAPKKRGTPVVKPDLDKLLRCVGDALTGAAWHDDGQVIEITGRKHYGLVEKTHILVEQVRGLAELLGEEGD